MKEFFEYSIAAQRGIIVLLVLTFVALVWRIWPVRSLPPDIEFTYSTEEVTGDSSSNYAERPPEKRQRKRPKKQEWNLATFDINYSKARELRAMGFSSEFISIWFQQKNETGFVTSFSQFENLNLLSAADLDKVRPYLDFSRYNKPKPKRTPKAPSSKVVVEINQADTVQFKQLYGIGSVLSKRIVKYRDKLGGFHSVQQVQEVYGVDYERFESIRAQLVLHTPVTKLALNSAVVKELAAHPYIQYKVAKALVSYRNQHGAFQTLDDVLKVYVIDEDWLIRIKPYLSLD